MTIGIKSPGRYIQGRGEIANLGKSVKKLGSKFLIVATDRNRARLSGCVENSLSSCGLGFASYSFGGECSKAEIASIEQAFTSSGCDAVIGIGGGKAIDAAKAAAENLGGVPLTVIPTVASNDAPCSGVAVIYNDEGVVIKALVTRRNPDLVLVDTDVIASSPKRLLAAGMGDALATYFEARACSRSGAKTMARGVCSETALTISRLCLDKLMRDGAQALDAIDRHVASPELESITEANILLSGIGWESGGLAAAHAVNDGLGHAPEAHGMYHGEKVAFGVLVQLVLEGENSEELSRVLSFMKTAGLPMTLAQLGFDENADNTASLKAVSDAAAVPTQSSKNLRADITSDDIYAAILRADEIGKAFLVSVG